MSDSGEHHWIAISDLLSGFVVVMILMLVTSVVLRRLEAESATERVVRERKQSILSLETQLEAYVAQGLLAVDSDNGRVRFMDASFPSGSACLDPRATEAARALAPEIASALAADPGLVVYVEGHTDASYFRGQPDARSAEASCGWFADNTQLSTVRAANVRAILTEALPVDVRARVPVSGWGAERLLAPDRPLGSENRRVEIRYVWPPVQAADAAGPP